MNGADRRPVRRHNQIDHIERKIIPVSFAVGQHVRYSYGEDMKIKGQDYVLVHEDNITAILN